MTMYNNWDNTPDWVLFVAKDSDGGWYGYETKPEKNKVGGYWAGDGNYVFLYRAIETRDWDKSLERRK